MTHYLPSVTVEEFTNIIKRQFEMGLDRPIFGLGKGGIGKTESIADLAKNELQIGYKDIRLLLYSESDLKGIPYVNSAHTHTIWLQNDILPREERDGPRGILVLDEVTSCSKSVRTAAYQLLNERSLGEYILPKGWMIVCLGNGEEDGGQFNGMEGNFANRCSVFQVITDLDAWKKWAFRVNIHPLVMAYVSWCPEHLHSFDPDKDEFVFASPRSWKAVSDILFFFGFDANDPLTTAQIYANVGATVGRSFLSFSKMQNLEANEILEGKSVKKPQSHEELIMLIQAVIYLLSEKLEKEENVQVVILDEKFLNSMVNGVNWMMSLEKTEHKMMAIKDFMARSPEKTNLFFTSESFTKRCPLLLEFATEHEDILTY